MSIATQSLFGPSATTILKDLKEEFYAWCGLLSIDEIASNTNLIRVIERIERMLLAAGA